MGLFKNRKLITVKRPHALKWVIGFFLAFSIVLLLNDTVNKTKATRQTMPKGFESTATDSTP